MFGWLHRLLFGKNGGKPKTKSSNLRRVSQKAPRRVPGQSTRTGSPGRSETARRSYIQRSSGQKRGNYGGSNYIPQEKKVQVKKPKKEAISKFDAYKKRLQESTSADKIAEDIKKLHERQNAANAEKAKKASSDAELKEISDAKARNLRELEGIKKKGGILDPRYVEDINKQIKHVKSKDFDKAYKKEKKKAVAKAAKEDLNRRLTMIGAKGLPAQHEEHKKVTKKIKKEAGKNKVRQLTTGEAIEAADPVKANLARTTGKSENLYSDSLRKKMQKNTQAGLDRGDLGIGFMEGNMPAGSLIKAVEKQYGIKLDDSKAKDHLGYNVAGLAGYLTKSATFGGATEEAVAKALTKVIAKKAGKKAVGKVGKFAANRAAEAISAAPVNIEDAARNSKDAKDFAKNVAINAGLDAGLGSVLDGGKFVAKAASDKATRKLLVKIDSGAELSDIERKSLQKKVTKVAGKKIAGSDLTEVEKKLYTKMHDGQIKKTLGKNKKAPETVNAKALTVTSDNAFQDASIDNTAKIKEESKKDAQITSEENITPDIMKKDSMDTNAGTNLTAEQNPASLPSKTNPSINNIPDKANVSNAPKKSTYLNETDVAPEYKKTYKEFVDSVDDEIVDYVSRAKVGKVGKRERHKFGGIRRVEADKIEALTGKDIDGYSHSIGLNDLEHIERRHGTKGEADHTMADVNDIGRIKYVIENYDDIKRTASDKGEQQFTHAYLDKNGKPAPLITYEKRVDGHVFVVEAVTDTSKKEIRVMTAYMNSVQNKKAPYTVDAKSPTTTSETAYTDASINNIPENSQNIKSKPPMDVDNELNQTYNEGKGGMKNGNNGAETTGETDFRGKDAGRNIQGRQGSTTDNRALEEVWRDGASDLRSHESVLVEPKIREKMNKSGINDLKLKDTSNDNAAFSIALDKSKQSNPYGDYVDSHDVSELTEKGTKTYLSEDAMAGVAIEKNGNITGVFKNAESKHRGAVKDLIITARENGGTKMDCYGAGLVWKYEELGYIPVAKVPFNPEYIDSPVLMKDKPDVYVLMKNADSVDQVLNTYTGNGYKLSNLEDLDKLPVFDDYDEALKYRDGLLAKQESGAKPKDGRPKMTADEVRKSVKEITDRELQTHGIKLMQSDTVSNDALRAEAMQAIKGGAFEKKAVKNSEVWEQAKKEISKDLEETYGHIMKLDGQPTSLDVARCYNLMIKFREQGDSKRWLEVCEKASGIMSETGRTLQAARMALRTTPEGRIRIVNRNIDYLNKKYADRLGGKKLELTDAQITKIMEATDDDAVAKVMNEINIETWNQIPATMFEKFNELRHCAMLLNPRTHIRNICGNMIFAPARTISGTISMGLEKGFSKKIAKMGGERTKSFVNRMSDDNLFKAARESFNMNYDASGSANRYIETHRPSDSSVFGGNAVGRVFEKARQFNYKALEKEDMVTFRPVYEKSYAKYLKANELDPKKMTPEQKVKAHDIALQQAEYATYRDATKLSSMITKAKEKSATAKGENLLGTAVYRTGNVVMESMIPFAKTPINIARRGIDYSPIGLAKGIARVAGAKDPETFIKGLDDLGAGLTGTGIVALGGLFADLGYVTVNVGGKSGEPYYERDMGEQDYSVNISIGGKEYSMSMDWAAPLNLPFFAGAAGFENLGKEGGGFADFVTGLAKIGEPLMEMSFMSGFTSLLQSNAKIDDGSAAGTIATNIMMTMPQQYLGSFIPSVFSQTANITDKYKRDTGSTSDDPVVKSWEQWARKQINKIPGLRQKLEKDVDVWGRYTEKKSTKDYIIEGIKATLCPATIKKKTYTDADRELIKLSKELDPETAQYIMPEDTFGYAFDLADGGRMKYSEKGKYQRERGQQNYKELTSLVSSRRYKDMTTEEKKKEIESIYDISQTKADRKVYGAKYAIKAIDKRGWGDSTKHQDQAEAYIQRGGSYEKYYGGYVSVEEVIRKSHYTGYESKAIGLRKAGADDALYQIYGVYKKTKDRVNTYFKAGGGDGEYYTSLNKMTRIISSYGVSDSNLNKAMALSEDKSNKRVYNVLGLENQANTGYGLVQYKYTPVKISEMKDKLCYDFDSNGSGSPNKDEVVNYIESLGLSDSTEKALLFSAFSQARNPYGAIPNYLGIGGDNSSGSGYSRGHRRYGSSGRRGSGSAAEEKTEFEKFIESLMKAQQSGSGIEEARMNYGSRKLNTKQYTSDQYRKAVARVLAKKLKA